MSARIIFRIAWCAAAFGAAATIIILKPRDGGTLMRDEMKFEAPLWPIGRVVEWAVLARGTCGACWSEEIVAFGRRLKETGSAMSRPKPLAHGCSMERCRPWRSASRATFGDTSC